MKLSHFHLIPVAQTCSLLYRRLAVCNAPETQAASDRPPGSNSLSRITPHSSRSAFTMIEIAISLAVIGFALVAIIGILPTGMQVQKDNRQETIINQDATVILNAIKNGERGLDDLTNYVFAITNYSTPYTAIGPGPTTTYAYTYNGSWIGTTPQ